MRDVIGKELVVEMLDVLVKMSNHCINMERVDKKLSKCVNCAMSRDFGYSHNGCLLVDILNDIEFMDLLIDTCRYQNIDYKDKLNKCMDIFVTECD